MQPQRGAGGWNDQEEAWRARGLWRIGPYPQQHLITWQGRSVLVAINQDVNIANIRQKKRVHFS